MIIQPKDNKTICNYLFGKEAEEIFTKLPIKNVKDVRKFIDQCLDVCVRVHHYLLTEKQDLSLVDPRSCNNQCHLFSLRAIQIIKTHGSKLENLSEEENRFLHLCLFVSIPLTMNMARYKEAIKETLSKIGKEYSNKECLEKNFHKIFFDKEKYSHTICKNINAFLQDDGNYRVNAARESVNQIFEQNLVRELEILKSENKIYSELHEVATKNRDDLFIKFESVKGERKYYTFPKLCGVVHMVETLARDNIPFALKVQVVTKEGVSSSPIMEYSCPVEEKSPVLVFEGVASDGLSLSECQKKLKDQNKALSEHEIAPYRERIKGVLKNSKEMFYALGADFILNVQKDYKFFFDRVEYPLLSGIFQQATDNIDQLKVGMSAPLTFTVYHAYPDYARHVA